MAQNNYQNTVEYLLKVLNFNEYKQLPEDTGDYTYSYVRDIRMGKLTGSVFNHLNPNKETNKEKKEPILTTDKDKNKGKNKPITIAIIPKLFDKILIDQKDCEESHEKFIPITPFYITANMEAGGTLDLASAKLIWANCLESPCNVDGVSFIKHAVSGSCDKTSWSKFIDSVQRLYEERYGVSWDCTEIMDSNNNLHPIITLENNGKPSYWIMREDRVNGTTSKIVKLLQHLKSNPQKMNGLLETMLGKAVAGSSGKPQLGKDIAKHLGQMKNEYPLADAQRHAVHCMSKLTNGNVLAVSGPPGTGKTTMLQSIVADLIVRHALMEKPEPPVILATSANNKAITNIINSFKTDDKSNVASPLFTRWLMFNDSPLPLAIYLPSGMAKDKDNFFCSNEIGGDDYQQLRSLWKDCKNNFLDMAQKSDLETSSDIPTVKREIYRQLQDSYGMLKRFDESLDNGLWSKIIAFFRDSSKSKMSKEDMDKYLAKQLPACSKKLMELKQKIEKKLDPEKKQALEKEYEKEIMYIKDGRSFNESIDRMIDICLRFKCFWLAVHYFEACWLEKVQENPQLDLSKQYRGEVYKEMAYVSPCIVATFFRAPGCFRKNKDAKEGDGYLFDFLDLLIVDEAGQACTEIGLPTFALAKKAIVVGDENQIPPIYSVKTGTSRAYWGKDIDNKTFKLIDCSSSSVMRVASKQSAFNRKWSDGDILEGLFLDEHRRCYDDIIAYCNQLIYKGRLKALGGKPKVGESVLPVMGHFCVPHPKSETPPTGSRRSKEEAQAIAQWIKQNEEVIRKENKGKDPKECISVITPFTLQAKLIREELAKVGYVYDNENKGNDKGIPVGTVHTFQGAESPIVIYSTVYGFEEKFSFVDGNRELMNVAVSRAKKHFFLFSSKTPEQAEKNASPFNLLLKMTPEEVKEDYTLLKQDSPN